MSHAEGENICNRVVAYDHRRNRLSVYRSRFGFAVLDLRDHILNRLRFMPDRVREMRTVKDEPFVNFALMKDIEKAIAASTSDITARLDAMEKTSLLDKIDRLREEKTVLANQLSQEHQSLAIFQNTAAELAPITAALNSLHNEVDSLKCKLPTTVTANYQPYTVVPTCAYNQFSCGWNGWHGNSLWG